MKVSKAISILKQQREKLSKGGNRNPTWAFQTASYIKDMFGEESPEYLYIREFSFQVRAPFGMPSSDVQELLNEKERQLFQYMDNCIETIQHRGLYKKPKKNFLSGLDSTAMWTIISLTVTALYGGGMWHGQYLSDVKNYKLEQEVIRLRDSLSFTPALPKADPEAKARGHDPEEPKTQK